MPKFSGEYRETVTVSAPIDAVKKHFADLPTIAANYGDLQGHEIHDEAEITFTLMPMSEKGVTFNGQYRARYEFKGDNRLTWRTVDTKNMWSTGTATFSEVGGDRTRIEFVQTIETDMQVNRLLAKVIKPIVSREITKGAKEYLSRMAKTAAS
ncbi:MAG: putative membrane protein [Bradymonadia bacterium]|jgi:uncharacterized membrane protein